MDGSFSVPFKPTSRNIDRAFESNTILSMTEYNEIPVRHYY